MKLSQCQRKDEHPDQDGEYHDGQGEVVEEGAIEQDEPVEDRLKKQRVKEKADGLSQDLPQLAVVKTHLGVPVFPSKAISLLLKGMT